MEVIAQTDFQDIYKIQYGVLMIVNKFKPIVFEGVDYPRTCWTDRSNSRVYAKGCQEDLKRLIKEYNVDKIGKFRHGVFLLLQ